MKQDASDPLPKKLRQKIRHQARIIKRQQEHLHLEILQQDNRFLGQQLRSAKNYGPTA